ncbi:hypothetical protein ACLOJK_012932 [Asimina triloba]
MSVDQVEQSVAATDWRVHRITDLRSLPSPEVSSLILRRIPRRYRPPAWLLAQQEISATFAQDTAYVLRQVRLKNIRAHAAQRFVPPVHGSPFRFCPSLYSRDISCQTCRQRAFAAVCTTGVNGSD